MRKTKRPCLRIASYNVHSWIGRDGRSDPDRTVEVLRDLDSSVISLQEARALRDEGLTEPLMEWCEACDYELVEGPTLEFDRASYGNALLTRHTIQQVSRIDLSVAGREPRGALSVTIEVGDQSVQVVSTHLGLRARERSWQISKLLDWMGGSVAEQQPSVLALVGDINEWRPLSDSIRRIDRSFEWGMAPRTFPAAKPWFRLDRIWVLPRSAVVGEGRVHRGPIDRVASDHLPISVDLKVPASRWGHRTARLHSAA